MGAGELFFKKPPTNKRRTREKNDCYFRCLVARGSMKSNMIDDPQKFLEVAIEAVKKAEPIFLKSFGNASGIETKHGAVTSFVTEADKEIEHLLRECISSAFPSHAIVGEEEGGAGGARYTWYIDPIDGTTNYIHGLHHCAISIALWDAEGPLVGIVCDPVNRRTYTAIRGGGAFENGQPIHVSNIFLLKDGVGSLGWAPRDSVSRSDLCGRIEKSAYRFRVFSGSALEICFVASGILDFYVTSNIHIWDMAAAVLILTEAGGVITERSGGPVTTHSTTLVGANRSIHGELIEVLK